MILPRHCRVVSVAAASGRDSRYAAALINRLPRLHRTFTDPPTLMLTEEQTLIDDAARRFSRDVLAPGAAAREKAQAIEPAVFEGLAAMGLLGMTVSPDHDGSGADYVSYALALMAVAEGDGAVSTVMSVHNAPFCAILERYGSATQKAEVLRPAARGEFIGAFALTESQAGSDASALRTRAVRHGNDYVINGAKQFITSGKIGRYTIVFAVTDVANPKRGISAFLVPVKTPGFKIEYMWWTFNMPSDHAEVSLTNVTVPGSTMLGEEGQGFALMMTKLAQERLAQAIRSATVCESVIEYTVAYTAERKAFNQTIADFQNTQFKLAELKTETVVGRTFTDQCIKLFLEDKLDAIDAAMAKMWLSNLQHCLLITSSLLAPARSVKRLCALRPRTSRRSHWS